MDQPSPTVALCIQGTEAEYGGNPAEAARCYQAAWDAAQDDYDACVAAHYLARYQPDPAAVLHWNQVALAHAEATDDARVQEFYPSLYVNLGWAYEQLGQTAAADIFYARAAQLGLVHKPGEAPSRPR